MCRRIAILLPACLLACGETTTTGPDATEPEPDPPVATSLAITPATDTLIAIGDTVRLTAAVRDQEGELLTGTTVAWISLDTTVVAVSAEGVATARHGGAAEIVAQAGTLADTANVTVEQIPATILIVPERLTVGQGDTARLSATVVDANGIAIEGMEQEIAWSSDDEFVAHVDSAGLVTITETARGLTTTIHARTGAAQGAATASVMHRLLFLSDRDDHLEIYSMNADGSGLRRLTDSPGLDHEAAWSHDGTQLAFVSERGGDRDIYVMNADGSGVRNLTDDPSYDAGPAWGRNDRTIAFFSDRAGYADTFLMNADGNAQTNLTADPNAYHRYPVPSPSGPEILFRRDLGDSELYLLTRNMGMRNLTADTAFDAGGVWSPDGSRIAFITTRDGNREIYTMNADGSSQQNLTNDPGLDESPRWSPDGTRIAFVSDRDGERDIFVMNADGSGVRNLSRSAIHVSAIQWSPDGTQIAYRTERDGDEEHHEIFVMNADGSGQKNLTNDPADDSAPLWQPPARRVVQP